MGSERNGDAAESICSISQRLTAKNLVWAAVGIGVFVGFSLHLEMLVERYQSFPVNTESEEITGSYEFPDVTLCPTDYLSRSYARSGLPGLYSSDLRPRGVQNLIYDIPRMIHLMQAEDRNASLPAYPFTAYRDGRLALNKVAYRSKQFSEAHEIFISCKFNSRPCSFANFTVYKDENYFTCFTFSPQNRTVIEAAPGAGLHILFLIYGNAFVTPDEEMDHKSGLKVVLHRAGTKPNFLGPHFLAAAQYKTDAIIDTATEEKVSRESYPCVQSLPNVTYITDYSQLNATPQAAAYFGTASDCKFRAMQEEFARDCGCLATDLPLPADLYQQTGGVCHDMHEEFMFREILYNRTEDGRVFYTISTLNFTVVSDGASMRRVWDKIHLLSYLQDNYHLLNGSHWRLSCYHRVRDRQRTDGVSTGHCPVVCRTTRHSVATPRFLWPGEATSAAARLSDVFSQARAAAQASNLSLADLDYLVANPVLGVGKYMGVLDLYPRQLAVKVSREDWAYPLKNFFSDLGGILGLWIGASIVTIVELLEALISCLLLAHKQLRARKETAAAAEAKTEDDSLEAEATDQV